MSLSKKGKAKKDAKAPEMDSGDKLRAIPVTATATYSQQQGLDPTLEDIHSVLPSLLGKKRAAKARSKFAATRKQHCKPPPVSNTGIGVSTRFGTNDWVDVVVKSLRSRAEGYEEVKKSYDTVERDMFQISNRWDRLISSLRTPFEESAELKLGDGTSSEEKLGPDDLLEPLTDRAAAALTRTELNWTGPDWV